MFIRLLFYVLKIELKKKGFVDILIFTLFMLIALKDLNLILKLYIATAYLLRNNILKKKRELNILFFISGRNVNSLFLIHALLNNFFYFVFVFIFFIFGSVTFDKIIEVNILLNLIMVILFITYSIINFFNIKSYFSKNLLKITLFYIILNTVAFNISIILSFLNSVFLFFNS